MDLNKELDTRPNAVDVLARLASNVVSALWMKGKGRILFAARDAGHEGHEEEEENGRHLHQVGDRVLRLLLLPGRPMRSLLLVLPLLPVHAGGEPATPEEHVEKVLRSRMVNAAMKAAAPVPPGEATTAKATAAEATAGSPRVRVAELVIVGLLLRVGEYGVRVANKLKRVLCPRRAVLVRVELQGQPTVGFLDLVLRRCLLHPEHRIVTFFCNARGLLYDCELLFRE